MYADFAYAITFASLSYDAEGNLTKVSSGVDAIFDSFSDAVDAMEYEFHEYDEDGIKTGCGLTKYRIVIRDRSNTSKQVPLVAGNMEIRRDQGYRRCESGNLRFLVFASELRCSKNRPGIHPI